MAQSYAYKARTGAGKVVSGRIDASNESHAASQLIAQGVSPISIVDAPTGTGLNRELAIPGFGGVKLKDLAVLSRQMATMLSAGLSLVRTLTIVAGQTENATLRETMGKVRGDVERGSSFSEALARHGDDFPPLMISLVRAGETSGFLDDALGSIAANFEADVKLRNTVRSAMTYPVVVLAMAILGVIGMLVFIVPSFQTMFDGLGGELPLPTQFLVWLSGVMVWLAPLLLVGAVVFAVWWRKARHTERVRSVVDPFVLRLPVFGGIARKIAVARFSRNFKSMVAAGVPVLSALQIAGETSGNWVVEAALRRVADDVRSGATIAEPLANEPVFPPMVTQMIAVGEGAGALEPMLEKIAEFYDQEVEATTEQLTSLIEPLLVAVIGVVIGGMIVALYLPIFSIFEYVK